MAMELSGFARSLTAEAAFTVLAVAKRLQSDGKDVVELEIGDSPFATTSAAVEAGREAIAAGHTRYCASLGLPELRDAAARYMRDEFGVPAGRENVVIATGTKVFEQYFCEAFVDPGDGVLVFSPYFPTYVPNILRRGGRPVFTPLRQEDAFRPSLAAVERFLADDPRPRAIFLNSPHNPTGGVATEDDFRGIADMVRGTRVAVFSDEPYCHMVWKGKHVSPLAQPGMMERSVAAYTFSKSYSMGGWRLGFAVSAPETVEAIGKMINTSVSCAPPFVQLAGVAALERDSGERDEAMRRFRRKVELLTDGLNRIEGFSSLDPHATFYVFPKVAPVCNRLGITSHGLAMYLLEGADDDFGVACLGGECFGDAGAGFLRFSCAATDERLQEALDFIAEAVTREGRVAAFLDARPGYRRESPYPGAAVDRKAVAA
ncbi:MAG: aminotransferase class I/II-fold pyridoxal phosphate-dependent enzyme, partial [Gammaproteobacteria bacterium]|nr:aminotransferase class I/II-fold pyridoxal phosphate-dependent enzyme [Gammaproteobacteria bacterium]